jgi:hypothetical protein
MKIGLGIGLVTKTLGGGAIPPVNTVAPVISGTAVVGQVLSTTNGTWDNIPLSFSYQWKRGVTNVGTNANTYTLVAADAGQSITCVVTGTNAAGSNNATSNALIVLATTLDIYPTASSAYSVRLLRGARYDNALIRARRSSDNAEVDVFVDSNFQLSLSSNITSRTSGTTLGTWAGANSVFVTIWYDQSGNNNNATQTSPANQPTIVASGVLQTNLGKAALLFNGTMSLQATVNWTNLFATYTVAKLNSLAPAVQAFYRDNGSTNSTGVIAFSSTRSDTYRVRTSILTLSSINSTEFGTTTKLITLSSDASNGFAYVNNNLRVSNAVSGNVGTIMYIGANGAGNTGGIAGPMSEWITYPSNSNLTAINSNINTYYSVYPVVSDADAQAFIEATGIDSTTQANAINTLVIGMKAQGLWTKMKAVYPMVGGTADSHKYNLKNPLNTDAAFRLQFTGGWTHSALGALPNGSNTFARTYLVPTTALNTNDHAIFFYTNTNNGPIAVDPLDMGSIENINSRIFLYSRLDAGFAGAADGNFIQAPYTAPLGCFALVTKQSATVTSLFKNTTKIGTINSGGTPPPLYDLIFGNVRITGTPYGAGWSTNRFAMVGISDGLSDADSVNLYNLTQAFQTSLSRQINP